MSYNLKRQQVILIKTTFQISGIPFVIFPLSIQCTINYCFAAILIKLLSNELVTSYLFRTCSPVKLNKSSEINKSQSFEIWHDYSLVPNVNCIILKFLMGGGERGWAAVYWRFLYSCTYLRNYQSS